MKVAKSREELEMTFKFKRGEWELISRILAQHRFSSPVISLNTQIRDNLCSAGEIPKPGTLCKTCGAYENCNIGRDASQYCGGYKKK